MTPGSLTYVLCLMIMFIGAALSILPAVPGPPIVWLGALLYGWSTDWVGIGWLGLGLLLVLALVGGTSDWWLSALVLKRQGGSIWGMVGSFAGGLVGFFVIPVIGIIVGSLLGVAIAEWLVHRDVRRMFGAGRGFLLGWLLSTVAEVVFSVVMIIVFGVIAR